MSRSGYSEDFDSNADYPNASWLWMQSVQNAIKGRRGQALMKEMLAALDAMPEKKLVKEALEEEDGAHCALGVVGAARGMDMSALDPEEPRMVAKAFGIARAMAAEIAYQNDEESPWTETPEARWARMRQWVAAQIK